MSQNIHQEYLDLLSVEIEAVERRALAIQEQLNSLGAAHAKLRGELDELSRIRSYVAARAGIELSEEKAAQDPVYRLNGEPQSSEDKARPHADAIVEVLKKEGRPMRVMEIVDAVAATGHPMPDEPRVQYSAIYAALHRRPNTFAKDAQNRWSLIDTGATHGQSVEHRAKPAGGEPAGGGAAPSYAEAAVIVAKDVGGAIKTAQVADYMIRMGYKLEENRKNLCNTIYNCLDRSPDFVKLGQGRWRLAKR